VPLHTLLDSVVVHKYLWAIIGRARGYLVSGKALLIGAVIGSTLMALSLGGSYRNPVSLISSSDKASVAVIERYNVLGKTAIADGRYQDAREAFWAAAATAMRAGIPGKAALNWSNAGYASLAAMQYRSALEDLTRARRTAETHGEMRALIFALNNLASLYLQMGDPEDALRIAREALDGPAGHADPAMRAKLLCQEAMALAKLGLFDKAEPIFLQGLSQITANGDLDGAARVWSGLGSYYIDAGRYQDAEQALDKSLRLVRDHGLRHCANALTNLAVLKGKQGDRTTAEHLFQEALDAHDTVTPTWGIYCDRGLFRMAAGNDRRALEDFRLARRFAIQMRADIVPADQTRVGIENRVSKIFEGLVDAGNRLALDSHDNTAVADTFDAAEQDRLWSLRSLVPEANDWRSRLPTHYWELLVRFQSVERSLLTGAPPGKAPGDRPDMQKLRGQEEELGLELEKEEAAAGSGSGNPNTSREGKPSKYVQSFLDGQSVLFSFLFTEKNSWLWTVDRGRIAVYSLPQREQIRRETEDFTRAIQTGADTTEAGDVLYRSLFSSVPEATLAHKKWFIEPDGPLYDLPFAALPFAGPGMRKPHGFLIERASLQSIPGALLLERGSVDKAGAFVGIGDPVFNGADSRYSRNSANPGAPVPFMALPRLPNTAGEIDSCSRAWSSAAEPGFAAGPIGAGGLAHLLTGPAANIGDVETAISASPAVIHFATHVVAAPGDYGSGLIALSLDAHGAMGLLGPKDIAARRISGSLVVMDGCHSARGEALPGSGLMGLTRAWIGAGANAVISTRWDVPDASAQTLMVNFYLALQGLSRGNPADALRRAQLMALGSQGGDRRPLHWAGYFLLSRI